jgi:hypothetical protein
MPHSTLSRRFFLSSSAATAALLTPLGRMGRPVCSRSPLPLPHPHPPAPASRSSRPRAARRRSRKAPGAQRWCARRSCWTACGSPPARSTAASAPTCAAWCRPTRRPTASKTTGKVDAATWDVLTKDSAPLVRDLHDHRERRGGPLHADAARHGRTRQAQVARLREPERGAVGAASHGAAPALGPEQGLGLQGRRFHRRGQRDEPLPTPAWSPRPSRSASPRQPHALRARRQRQAACGFSDQHRRAARSVARSER